MRMWDCVSGLGLGFRFCFEIEEPYVVLVCGVGWLLLGGGEMKETTGRRGKRQGGNANAFEAMHCLSFPTDTVCSCAYVCKKERRTWAWILDKRFDHIQAFVWQEVQVDLSLSQKKPPPLPSLFPPLSFLLDSHSRFYVPPEKSEPRGLDAINTQTSTRRNFTRTHNFTQKEQMSVSID